MRASNLQESKMDSLVLTISLLFVAFSYPLLVESAYNDSYYIVSKETLLVESAYNDSDYNVSKPATLNPIDACWRRNPAWAKNRQALAKCAVGFGKAAMGGQQGAIYTVTTPVDDPKAPKPGSLRFGAVQKKPLWITFAKDMVIVLKKELLVSSYKTIDGRGAKVKVANGPCFSITGVKHVIVHGITFQGCKPSPTSNDGDAIRISQSQHVWVDHCHLSRSQDGLIDVILASKAVTISNNYLTQHSKAMLLGNDDKYVQDQNMRVTVAFNYFGPGLSQRMPRVRRGYAHIANNRYEKWGFYAIGGSANPIIFSEGNYFVAPDTRNAKQVTKRVTGPDSKLWRWSSTKDVFLNGAFFGPVGASIKPPYKGAEPFPVAPGSAVPSLTASAGTLPCVVGRIC